MTREEIIRYQQMYDDMCRGVQYRDNDDDDDDHDDDDENRYMGSIDSNMPMPQVRQNNGASNSRRVDKPPLGLPANPPNKPSVPTPPPFPLPTPSLPSTPSVPYPPPASPNPPPFPLPTPSLPTTPSVPYPPPASPNPPPFPLPTPSLPSPIPPTWKPIKPCSDCVGACLPYAYPPISAKAPNDAYACIIFSLYAGKSSEVTAVMRYLYDSTTFMSENKEAAETLKKIAMCEMHHMQMLAELLLKLGATPKYHSCDKGQFTWWNAGAPYMVYPTYIKMALLENLDSEKKAIEAYNNAIKAIDDNFITTLLRRIMMDEEHHINLLSEIYNRCCR